MNLEGIEYYESGYDTLIWVVPDGLGWGWTRGWIIKSASIKRWRERPDGVLVRTIDEAKREEIIEQLNAMLSVKGRLSVE